MWLLCVFLCVYLFCAPAIGDAIFVVGLVVVENSAAGAFSAPFVDRFVHFGERVVHERVH